MFLVDFVLGSVKSSNFIVHRKHAQVSLIDFETCFPILAGVSYGRSPVWASQHSLRSESVVQISSLPSLLVYPQRASKVLSFRGDLHSLAYCLVYLVEAHYHGKSWILFAKCFEKYCLSLGFSTMPDYSYFRNCIHNR